MKKSTLAVLLATIILFSTVGIAVAVWEDTKGTQVTANILPLPGGTFQIVSAVCDDSVVGFQGYCHADLYNESATIMSVDTITVTTGHPYVIVTNVYGEGASVEPGQQSGIQWYFTSDPLGGPGEVTFDVEVTCSGE